MSTQVSAFPFFTPTQISGCQLWLDGADPNGTGVSPTNRSVVSSWVDKSGNARNLTGSGTPTFLSGGGINFNGTNSFFTNTNFAYNLSTRSVFLVAKLNTFLQYAGFITFIPNPSSGVDQNSLTGMSVETASSAALSFNQYLGGPSPLYSSILTATLTNVNLYNDNMNGTIGSGFVNGNTITNVTTATVAGTTSGFGVGTRWQGSMSLSYIFTGNIYDIILYNGPLTAAQRQQVEGYLAWKWGLQANLPANHPYKNSPIPPLLNPPRTLPSLIQNPVSFVPTQISGCSLWLDGADTGSMTLSGSSVTQWNDKSVNRFIGTAVNGPTVISNGLNGLPVIRFNGINQYIDFGNILNLGTNGLSMFAVTKFAKPPDTIDNGGWIVGKTSYRGNYGRWGMGYDGYYASGMFAYYEEATTFVGPSFPFNPSTQFNLFSSQTNRTSFSRILQNGILGAQSNISLTPTNMSSTDRLFVATYGNSTGVAPLLTYNLNGDIAEILVYFASFSDAQRQQVEGYLAWKWGLQASLPATHPYKAGPPYSATIITPSRSLGIPATWQPTQISGLQLWLDAADVNGNGTRLANGASVSTWVDKSGIGNNAVGTVAPTYDSVARYVLFNGSTQFFTLPNGTYPFGNTPYSIFIVAYTRNAGNPQWVLAGGNETTNQAIGLLFYVTNAVWHSWWVNEYRVDNSIVNNVPSIVNISYSSTRSIIVNGGTASVNSPGATRNNPNTSNFIGRRAGGASQFFDGGMAECIVFNSEIPTSQRQQVEGYLAWKWGLVSNLPNNHPYKKWPPSP